MKRIVSVSLGSSIRDHAFETEILGEQFSIERMGTDGDWGKAIQLIQDLDGKVDAFGMGGIDLYVHISGKRYIIREACKLANAAQKTPIVDGSGLKNTLERKCILDIQNDGIYDLRGKQVLMVSAVDRFGMAEAFDEVGAHLTLGDLIYAIGVPIAMHSLRTLRIIGGILAPLVVQLPFDMLYPTGKKQDDIIPKHSKYYYKADVLAGDFMYIRRYLPPRLEGKIIVTNTTTQEDLLLLKERGIKMVITTTPDMGGRSFGTNVIEALMVSMIGKPLEQIQPADYYDMLKELDLKPGVIDLENMSA